MVQDKQDKKASQAQKQVRSLCPVHIAPRSFFARDEDYNSIPNIIVAKSDLARLFKRGKIGIADDYTSIVSPELRARYPFHGKKTYLPEDPAHWPSRAALAYHRKRWGLDKYQRELTSAEKTEQLEQAVKSMNRLMSQEKTKPKKLLWLSFGDADGFRGAVITKERGIMTAIVRTRQLGINPGGEVLCLEMDDTPQDVVRVYEGIRERGQREGRGSQVQIHSAVLSAKPSSESNCWTTSSNRLNAANISGPVSYFRLHPNDPALGVLRRFDSVRWRTLFQSSCCSW